MNDAVFAPDGRHLLVANMNQTAYILRLDLAQLAQTPVDPFEQMQSCYRARKAEVKKNAKLQTICCSANLHSGYAVSLRVTQLALQRHEVPETHKNYRHAYGAYRQHDDHAWSAFTGSGFFCGFNDAALGCLLWHHALLDFSRDKSST